MVHSKDMTQPPIAPDRKTDNWGLDLYDWFLILTISLMICISLGHGARFALIWDAAGFALTAFFVWCGYGIFKNVVTSVWPKNAGMIQKITELLSIALLGVVLAKVFGS